jgi:hypothetical protein
MEKQIRKGKGGERGGKKEKGQVEKKYGARRVRSMRREGSREKGRGKKTPKAKR